MFRAVRQSPLLTAVRSGVRQSTSGAGHGHAADGDYDPLAGAPAGGRVGSTREDVAWDPLR
jgi:hypothetical protein